MITNFEDFCTYSYVVIDELWQKIGPRFRHSGPQSEFSDSELITVAIVSECRGWDQETELLSHWQPYRYLFPKLPERSRFNRRRRRLMGAINLVRLGLQGLLDLADDRQCVIDSLPIGVVQFQRVPVASGDWATEGAAEAGAGSKAGQGLAEANSEAEKAQVRFYLRLLEQTFAKFEDFKRLLSLPMRSGKQGKAGNWRKAEQERLWRSLTPKYATHLLANNAATTTATEQLNPDESQPEVAVEEFLQEHTRITLLGAPGAGKSTTLRRLVRAFGYYWTGKAYPDRVELKAEWQGRIPLYVFLNQWQNPQMGLVEFVQEQIRGLKLPTPPLLKALAERVPELMETGRVVLLLDGLNELPGLARNEQSGEIVDPRARAIAELGERAEWEEAGCVLSCRVREFTGGPNWHWRDLHMLPLKREQVEEFARAYFEGESQAEPLVSKLIEELYQSGDERKEKLQKLAEQPFYLRKFLAYYEALGFPDNAAQLLNHSFEEALCHEVEDKTGLLHSEEEAKELATRLSYLAFNLTDAHRVGGVDEAKAARWLFHLRETEAKKEPEASPQEQQKAKELLRQGEGLGLVVVVEGQNRNIQFAHQLWQEYFAARYIISLPLDTTWFFRATDWQYQEVWRLCGGLDERLVDRLTELLLHSEGSLVRSLVRSSAADALGKLGDSRAVEALITVLQRDKDSSVRFTAADALGKLGDSRALPALEEAARSDEGQAWFDKGTVKEVAAETIERIKARQEG
jgi:hypothetical protein